jgi:cytochrome c2
MIARTPAALAVITSFLVPIIAAPPAAAGCAEDITRIELALPAASPDTRAAAQPLAVTARARAKAKDGDGCTAATAEALRLLGLPNLAPLTLSTPVPGVPAAGATVSAAPAPTAPAKPAAEKKKKTTAKEKVARNTSSNASPDWYVLTSSLIGSDVTTQDRPNASVGTIKSLVIDATTRQATLALIETGGVLGFGDKLVAVPFAALHFSGRWDRPTILASLATLQASPRVSAADVPNLMADTKWRADLAKRYKVAIAAPTRRNTLSPPTGAPQSTVGVAASAAGDAAAGASTVQGICAACHTLDANGGTRVGPALYGIVARSIAAEPGFTYSAALKTHGGAWSAANLDGFLKNPQAFAPGTTMPFAGIASDAERRNVIAYLETLGGPK